MSAKGRKRQKKISVEDIYRNNNFVPPKEQNLETIFEEPRLSKDGAQILTSVKKYKRYLHFDDTLNKIQKRKRNAKKCVKKFKSAYQITRSSLKDSECDYSYHILDILDSSLSDSDEDSNTCNTSSDTPVVKNRGQCGRKRTSADLQSKGSHPDITPERKRYRPNSRKQSTGSQEIDVSKSEITTLNNLTGNASTNCAVGNTYTNDATNDTSTNSEICDTSINDKKPNDVIDVASCASTSHDANNNTQVSDTKKEDDVQSPKKSCIVS